MGDFEFKITKVDDESEDNDSSEEKTNEGIPTYLRYSADFHEEENIGEGAFGRAFRCTHKVDRGEYGIKMVPLNEHDREKKLREVVALKRAQHCYYQCWIEGSTLSSSMLFIAMDYYPMTLKEKLVESLEEAEIIHLFEQLIRGLAHIHKNGVIHFDIKPDNIFLDHPNKLMIGDFGLAASSGQGYTQRLDSSIPWDTSFRAPEMRLGSQNLTDKVDVFSAGIVLLEMLISPISDPLQRMSVFDDAAVGLYPEEAASPEIRYLLNACLNEVPEKRLSAMEILKKCF